MDKRKFRAVLKKEGFDSIDDFVRANLHYLPAEKQRLFYSVCEKQSDPDKYSGGYYVKS